MTNKIPTKITHRKSSSPKKKEQQQIEKENFKAKSAITDEIKSIHH